MVYRFTDPETGEDVPPCRECGSLVVRGKCSSCGVLNIACGICGRWPDLECRAHFVAKIRELEDELTVLRKHCEDIGKAQDRAEALTEARDEGHAAGRAEALAMGQPWSVLGILARLADAADHLLSGHDCDHLYYESAVAARDAAREFIRTLTGKVPPTKP